MTVARHCARVSRAVLPDRHRNRDAETAGDEEPERQRMKRRRRRDDHVRRGEGGGPHEGEGKAHEDRAQVDEEAPEG